MRKFAMALGIAAAMILTGGVAWKAEATSLTSGTVNLPGVAKNYSPVEQTAWRVGPDVPSRLYLALRPLQM